MTTNSPPPLSQAPPAVQLAVDLIMLLEQHNLAPDVVLAALAIVSKDYQHKAKMLQSTTQVADN
ncbi:MAG: DUF2496 domain-containing protein [Gammaproteobacteria bacterium]|nr:DUF2496 domain-containing protein [Gammaproteobacteria bacterium]